MLRQTSLYLETVLNNLDAGRTNTIIHSLTSPFVITPANDVLPSKVTNSRIFEESGTSQIATGLANKSTNCAITTLPQPVAKDYSRPPGLEYRPRLSTKFSYRTTSNIMNEEITKLLKKTAIVLVKFAPIGFYSRLFLVPKKEGSFRPVIDLSQLNKFITNEHFQMENLMYIYVTYQLSKLFIILNYLYSHILSSLFS